MPEQRSWEHSPDFQKKKHSWNKIPCFRLNLAWRNFARRIRYAALPNTFGSNITSYTVENRYKSIKLTPVMCLCIVI